MKEKYISRSTAVAARLLGDEMMIMSATDATLFSLNSVAACIWQAADGCTPLSEILERSVCAEFDVDLQTAYRDAVEFVDALAQHGILRVSDAPLAETAPYGVAP